MSGIQIMELAQDSVDLQDIFNNKTKLKYSKAEQIFWNNPVSLL